MSKIKHKVERFQARIVQAYKERNHEKVSALQFLITRSFYAKIYAVFLVSMSKGARTPGVDKQRWRNDHQKYRIALKMNPADYEAKPYLRIYIGKPGGGLRPLGIPTLAE
jgi:RNA-directed DNA polymerase